jgi:hypothetical protein
MRSGTHYLSTCTTVFNHPFAARSFRCALFSRSHSSTSTFFCHMFPFCLMSVSIEFRPYGVIVLESIVTAAILAKALPSNVAPVVSVMD